MPLDAETLVKFALDAFVAPIGIPLTIPPEKLTPVEAKLDAAIVPPVIATALAFCVAIVPKPNIPRSLAALAGCE